MGGVVEGAGGPATARSQLVQRTVDVLWHTLREESDHPVRWCPGPRVRQLMLLELTRWNDDPRRSKDEVIDLLRAAGHTAAVERERCLAERATLVGSGVLPSPS